MMKRSPRANWRWTAGVALVALGACKPTPPDATPVNIDVTFEPGDSIATCQSVKMTATLIDYNGNILGYSWSVVTAPVDARYELTPNNDSAQFTSEAVGDFGLQITATDAQGNTTPRLFSVHVAAGSIQRCIRPPATLDSKFTEMTRRVPEFGGAYIGPDGKLRLVLTNLAAASAAEDAVREIIGSLRPLPEGPAVAVQGDYTFDQLMATRVRSRSVLAVPGVVLLDADERKNRVRIGVESDIARQGVEQELDRLGVDMGMVLIELDRPTEVLLSNTDKVRPVIGGTKISPPTGWCTLGFVATRNGTPGFITASHCTIREGHVDGIVNGTGFAQPDFSDDSNFIGREIVDPSLFTLGAHCEDGRRCRESDAAFAAFAPNILDSSLPGVKFQQGLIYLQAPNPYGNFRVTQILTYPLSGETLTKVGATTSLTSGEVTDTCEDLPQYHDHQDTGITVACSYRVDARSEGGDSGSPVFKQLPGVPGEDEPVMAAGVLWGGPDDNSSFVFSPMYAVWVELGRPNVAFRDNQPWISIVSPTGLSKINYGAFSSVHLEAKTWDDEDYNCCNVVWSSKVDGGIIGYGKGLDYTFTTPGVRTIVATARDSFGNTTSDSVTVDTVNTPPTATIARPAPGQTWWRLLPYALSGWAFDREIVGTLPCSALTWRSTLNTDPFPAYGCSPQVTFLDTGTRTLTLTAKDFGGASGYASRSLLVAAPGGGKPIVSILQPADGSSFYYRDTVTLVGAAQDTDNPNGMVSYSWILVKQNGAQQVIGTSTGLSGGTTTLQWVPAAETQGFESVTIILAATDPEDTATDSIGLYIMGMIK